MVLSLLCLATPALSEDSERSDASAHVLQAEIALHSMNYLEAAREYRKAAELSKSTDIARQATRIASGFGFNEEALASAERWLEIDPDDTEALFHVARLQLRLGEARKAQRSFKELLKRREEPDDEVLLSLVPVFSEEDPEVSFKVMKGLAKPYGDSASANYAMAVVSMQANDLELAREHAQKCMDLEPGQWLLMKSKLLYGRIMLLEGDADGAIAYVAEIIGDDPQPDPSARMELALLMMSAGRDDDALSQVNQIQYETGANADALRLMAILNFRQENLDAAWEDFQDLLASGQHTMDALYYLARIADYREEIDRAIQLYSQVRTGAHTVRSQGRAAALVAFQREAPDSALENLDKFARDNPLYAIDMVQSKAQLLAALERYNEALGEYDRIVQFRPESENIALGRAELLLRMGRLDESIVQYRECVDRWPDSALSLNALGYTLADRTEDFREAEKLIRKALKYDPDNAAIIDSLGWVLFKLGRNEEALAELQRAYEGLDDPEVAAHIVEVLAVLERSDDAMEMLVAAETKDPESPLLKDVRERVFPDAE